MLKKITYSLSLLAFAALLPVTATAQTTNDAQERFNRLTPEEKARLQRQDALQYPLVYNRLQPSVNVSAIPQKPGATVRRNPQKPSVKSAPSETVVDNTEIWSNITSLDTWDDPDAVRGYYTFTPSGNTFDQLVGFNDFSAQYGNALVGNTLYGIDASLQLVSWGLVYVYRHAYDINNWQLLDDGTRLNNDMVALETATNQTDGTVYGEFYSQDFKQLELAKVDYAAGTRETIGTLQHEYVALGLSSDDLLFGIAKDGNLYQINPEDATEDLIGSTGFQLTNDNGQYYIQAGEIDQKTDKFYWAAHDINNNTGLYTVDLDTGKPTLVRAFNAIMGGMQIAPRSASDDVPAKALNLSVDFENESTTGTVSFTVPTYTYGGKALEGNVNYSIKTQEGQVTSGSTTPGATENVTITIPTGEQTVTVVLSNDKGDSPKAFKHVWVGYDVPSLPGNAALSIDTATRQAQVSWSAPTSGLHNAYLGPFTYNVYRISNVDTTLVANATSSTSFSETLPKRQLTRYAYAIVAYNGDRSSDKALTNSVYLGDAYDVPFFEDFIPSENFTLYKVINANNDQNPAGNLPPTWNPQPQNHRVFYYCQVEGRSGADDWLISPAINLKKGQEYVYSMKATNYWPNFPEKFEVFLGKEPTIEAMTQTILPATSVDHFGSYATFYNDTLRVADDGKYYFGIHAISDAGKYNLFVDSISINAAAVEGAPNYVENLKVTPEAKGERSATVSFNAPTKNTEGNALSGNVDITVKRNGDDIYDLTGVTPGAAVSFENSVPADGSYIYSVETSNSIGKGRTAIDTTYVGTDTPLPLAAVKTVDNVTSVDLNWNPVATTGAHGGIVNRNNVIYDVYDTELHTSIAGSTYSLTDKLASISDTTYNVAVNTDEGDQQYHYWAVQPHNRAGEAEPTLGGVFVGAPYTLPFAESFANETLSYFWAYSASTPNLSLVWSSDASDGDDYAVSLRSQTDNQWGELWSGKISVENAQNPVLSYDIHSTVKNVTVNLVGIAPDGTQTVLETFSPLLDYETRTVSLKQYANKRFLRFVIHAQVPNAGEVVMDNFKVYDDTENGINGIKANEAKDGDIYDLSGRRVGVKGQLPTRLPKGVYIQKGKKYIN